MKDLMKLSIKILAIIALVFTINFTANAQRGERPSAEKMAEKETTQMIEQLELNDVQAEKIKKINLAYAQKMQEAHESNNDNREAMKAIREAIDTEKSEEIKQVLTESQFKTYQEMQAKRGNKGKGKRKGGHKGNKS